METLNKINVVYWSDYSSPYCYIGEKRLRSILKDMKIKDRVNIKMKSLEIDSNSGPKVSRNTNEYISQRYGISLEEAKNKIEELSKLGKKEGIDFQFTDTINTNTIDAHRLTKLAKSKGKDVDRVIYLLFDGYFSKNLELSDKNVLINIGKEVGLEEKDIVHMLGSDEFIDEVRKDEREAKKMDIQGVPYIVINNKFSITGCQNEEMLKKLFIDALENKLEITKSGLIKIADDGYSTPINNNDSKKDHGKVAVKRVLVHDVFDTNSYFYIDEKTNHGFLLDPGAEPDKLIRIIKNNNWTIEKILLTHGHFDHTGAVEELYNKLNIPYFVHEKGELYLKSTHYNLSRYCERNVILNDGQYFKNGKIFSLSSNPNVQLRVIHTPGHTPDSVVFYDEYNKLAFVGDTIFKDSIGTTRYFGGNDKDLKVSILEKIFKLPEDVTLLSGHSEKTTVGREKSLYMF